MTKQVHIHIHRTKARDAGEGEGKWITLSPSGTHVKVDGKGEITAGPKGMTGKKPSELSKGASESPKPIKHATGQGQSFLPTQPKMGHGSVTKTGSGFTGMAHAGRPQGTAAVQARIDAKKAAGKPAGEGPRGASRVGSAGPATTKTDWSKSNGDWTTAKKEGAAMFERAMSSAKTGGDRTDAALKLKAEAAEQQKNGSYLGAVVLGLVNDYFDRLK